MGLVTEASIGFLPIPNSSAARSFDTPTGDRALKKRAVLQV
jgi:hypothetical protein